jgi:hypothetical protein
MSSDGDQPVQIGDRVAKALDNPWVVLGLLFFVFAIMGIPLIWISKAFPTWAKIVLSIVVTLYTALLLWGFWLIMLWSYNRIVDAL